MSEKSPTESVSTEESGILLKDEEDAKEEDNAKIFQDMSSLRIEGLKAMDKSVEGLVKKCLFWKDQLEALTEKNRLLKLEEKTLRKDYEELLEKTRSNTKVLVNLKDSDKRLVKELKEYSVEAHHLSASSYINVDLSSHRILLENDKKELITNLKTSNDKLSKINRIHQRLQDSILQQKKTAENNEKRFARQLAMLKECFCMDMERLVDVKKAFSFRESTSESVDDLLANGGLDYLRRDIEDNSTEFLLKKEEISTEISSKESDDLDQSLTSQPSEDPTNPSSEILSTELLKCRSRFEMVKMENDQLHKIYSLLINRMKKLNDLYIENSEVCNQKGSELSKVADKASDIFRTILQTRKKFIIPQRKFLDELDIKIRSQVQKNEALRKLISMFLSFDSDSQFYVELMSDIKKFYQSMFKAELEKFNREPEPSVKEKESKKKK